MIYTEGKRRLANFVAEVTPKLGFPGFCRNTFLNIVSIKFGKSYTDT